MATVKAPNGTVMELPDSVASGLVNGGNSEWAYVEAEPEPVVGAKPKPTGK